MSEPKSPIETTSLVCECGGENVGVPTPSHLTAGFAEALAAVAAKAEAPAEIAPGTIDRAYCDGYAGC